jgi:hypothetical protein
VLSLVALGGPGVFACTAPNPFFEHVAPDSPARPARDAGAADRARPPVPAETTVDAAAVVEVTAPAAPEEDGAVMPSSLDPVDASATDVPPAPLPVLPVARWRFDETTGKFAADSSGNGNDGTLAKGAVFTPDACPGLRFANPSALKLDGATGSLEIAVKSLPALAARKTISSWFWTAGGLSLGRRNIVELSNRAAAASIQVGLDFGRVAAWRWSDGSLVVMRDQITSAGWHHVAYVYDGNEHRLYFDGALADTSQLAALGAPVTSAHVGSFDGNTELFQGRLDDVRIYDQALTATQVKALASGDADAWPEPPISF